MLRISEAAASQAKSNVCVGYRGYIDKSGVFTSFDPPGSASTTINSVNDLDDIVSFYTSQATPHRLCRDFPYRSLQPGHDACRRRGSCFLGYRTACKAMLTARALFKGANGCGGSRRSGHGADSALVPASPPIEATAAQQKHDDDDDEKSCHIHVGVSFGRMFGYLISPAAGRTWLLFTARAAPLFLQRFPHCILDPTDRVLNFSGGFFIPSLDLKLGVAGSKPRITIPAATATKSANALNALLIGSNKPKPSANIVTQIAKLKISTGVISRLHLLQMRSSCTHQSSSPKPGPPK